MNKKSSLVIFAIFLLGCNNPSIIPDHGAVIHSSSIPSSTSSTPVEQATKPYNMNNIDLNNNIEFAKDIPISYNFNGKLNDKGNGLIILKSYAIKIVNFKQLEKKLIDNDFGDSSLSIDENGDGLLSWSPAQLITPASTNNAGVGLGAYKYKKVKNFDISDETFNSNPNQDNNSDLANTEKTKNLYKNVKENESVKIDENGNGLIIRDLTDSSFKISIIKNYNIENKEYNLFTQQKIITQYSNEINSKFDNQGNGFISWTYDYQTDPNELNNIRSEIVIKKLENFIPVGNEISLGSDYYGGQIILDKNGTGFIAWQKELDRSFSRVRKIKNYVPESKAYELSLNQLDSSVSTFRYNLNILTNNYGDGFIVWQEFNRQTNSYNYLTTCYVRPIENYNISTQNLKEYIPVAKPTPRPTPFID